LNDVTPPNPGAAAAVSPRTLLGIDIGGTKIAGGLVDAGTGAVLFSRRVATGAAEGGPAVLGRALALARAIREEAAEACFPAPVAVGVGAGGQIDPASGVVLSATDVLPGWAGTPLRDAFEDACDLPAAVDNDVNALAVGESRYGAGRGADDLIYLALGTGVGGAILLGGRLHHGACGAGGELGHLVLYPDGLPCTCGGRGCLEQYTNGAALARHYRDMGGTDPDMDGVGVGAEALREPDGAAARAVARLGEYLGIGLVSLANVFDPERIVVGGGVAGLGDRVLAPARRVLAERALPAVRGVPVVPAALGADAAVVGAASLALPFLNAPTPESRENVLAR
jgi:glucokinase